jgi:hypothetical protein
MEISIISLLPANLPLVMSQLYPRLSVFHMLHARHGLPTGVDDNVFAPSTMQ